MFERKQQTVPSTLHRQGHSKRQLSANQVALSPQAKLADIPTTGLLLLQLRKLNLPFKLSGLWHFVMAAQANHYRLHAVCLFSLHSEPINSNFSSIATPSESSDSPKCSPAPTSYADLSLEGLNTVIH